MLAKGHPTTALAYALEPARIKVFDVLALPLQRQARPAVEKPEAPDQQSAGVALDTGLLTAASGKAKTDNTLTSRAYSLPSAGQLGTALTRPIEA